MRLYMGRGVLAKDGSPYAPHSLMVKHENGFSSPRPYSMLSLLETFADPTVVEITVIDGENRRGTLKIRKPDPAKARVIDLSALGDHEISAPITVPIPRRKAR